MMPLFDHQKLSLEFLSDKERVFDASDPGTGKTRVAIEAFASRRIRGGGKALVLAPKSLLRAAWWADFKRFAPHIRCSVAPAETREESFAEDADVYITNHDAVNWLAKRAPSFFKGYDTLIIDEVGAFKHHTSGRSKALTRIKSHFRYRLVMNGTPAPNSVLDLWHQMFILDDGKRLGPSFYGFRNVVCTPKQVGPSPNMVKWIDREGSIEAVTKLMEDVTIRHKFEECLSIPANFTHTVPFFLTPPQQKHYEDMQYKQMTQLNNEYVTAINAASVATKLLQIASGAVYQTSDTYQLVDTARYELILDLIEAREHCIVFFLWRHQKEMLTKLAKERGITFCVIDGETSEKDRMQHVDFYQKGFYRVCFAHPQSAAHGLTLTRGTTTIWASPTYNLEHFEQGNKRIYRAGQTKRTETICVIAHDTIEEHVWQILTSKGVTLSDILMRLQHTTKAFSPTTGTP